VEIIIRKRDIYISTVILAAFGAWIAYALHDNSRIHAELEEIAAGHVGEWFENGRGEALDRDEFDYLAIVDSEKAFTLFGRAWGVVHTYFRRKGDESFDTFKGIEYFYVREDGEWKMHDSAGCGALEHHIRAFDAFMAAGVHVPNKVYDRALKIDFAYDMSHLDARNAAHRAGSN